MISAFCLEFHLKIIGDNITIIFAKPRRSVMTFKNRKYFIDFSFTVDVYYSDSSEVCVLISCCDVACWRDYVPKGFFHGSIFEK